MRLKHEPVCGPDGGFLRWKPERAADEYITYLEQDTPAWQQLYRAIENEEVEQAWCGFKSWLFDAVSQTCMSSAGTHRRTNSSQRARWYDVLSLTSTDHNELQTMLNKLRVYAQKMSLKVNTQKSEVMCCNCRPGRFLPPLFFDGVQLCYSDTFKYLGMVFDRQMNLNIAADAALQPSMAGTFRVKQSNSSRAIRQEPWPC